MTHFKAALFVLCLVLGVSWLSPAQAQVTAQIATLQKQVAALTTLVNTQHNQIVSLQARMACMSTAGTEVYFTGCNVHIVSGSGATDGAVNALGNLIIGYNEDGATQPGPPGTPSTRTGSHNLVIGAGHTYTSYGGIVVGMQNFIVAPYASVTGGQGNAATGNASSVTGGWQNYASGDMSTITGGLFNQVTGRLAVVSGGYMNDAAGVTSIVSGGVANSASGGGSSVSGGYKNGAAGNYASVSGGTARTAPTDYTWAAGGLLQ